MLPLGPAPAITSMIMAGNLAAGPGKRREAVIWCRFQFSNVTTLKDFFRMNGQKYFLGNILNNDSTAWIFMLIIGLCNLSLFFVILLEMIFP